MEPPPTTRRAAGGATLRKIERFGERLAAIRGLIAERRRDARADGPSGGPDAPTSQRVEEDAGTALESIKLPLLPEGARPLRASLPMESGHFLSINALENRAMSQQQYDDARERAAIAEREAAAAIQEADRLTEDARIAMVLYTTNERSWSFDERARRYQSVMQAKKEAEAARLRADDERVMAQCLRAQLADPYKSMRSVVLTRSRGDVGQLLQPLENGAEGSIPIWILGAPLLTPQFTPREHSDASVLQGEKELSLHVVYYAATAIRATSAASPADESSPPTSGWLCCSSHGVQPPPSLTLVKSTIETWVVSGAGVTHLNGKYIYSGNHNGVSKFKNSAGAELFRKQLPSSSSIVRTLLDASECSETINSKDDTGNNRTLSRSKELPSALQVMERNEHNFKAMERVGAWVGSDLIEQKLRRLREQEHQTPGRRDGDHVHLQDKNTMRLAGNDLVSSRPEANAKLCREWVLFLRCSRRRDQHQLDDAPKDGGIGCLKRHYFISAEEKGELTTWAYEQEAWLEKDVLSMIIRREAAIEQVKELCQRCMVAYQENLAEDTRHLVDMILYELSSVRFLSVKVLEAIDTWRTHARKRGFTRYDDEAESNAASIKLGWSASITVTTGKHLFRGSKPFRSKFKRFCRPEDPDGQREMRLVYLGYFATREEAERAYDDFANAEARRLNTTAAHLPRRRNVFRSCGKHFAVESERLGPDYCIECKVKSLSGAGTTNSVEFGVDDWNPPFHYMPGDNYILRMGHDLDFLDNVFPLKARLCADVKTDDRYRQLESFPLVGNVFLLPRTPIEDPTLAFFVSLGNGSAQFPGVAYGQSNQDEAFSMPLIDTALSIERVVHAQRIFIQELQTYQPELFELSNEGQTAEGQSPPKLQMLDPANLERDRRIVQALYWDRCAALRIEQVRPSLAFRQPGVWCRPDAGEWAGMLIRGKNQQHVLFEVKLANAGRAMHTRRKRALKVIRQLLKTPLYLISSRDMILSVIAEGEHVKGDVVMLETKSAQKLLIKYDLWCRHCSLIQKWYRGLRGKKRSRSRTRALVLVCSVRKKYLDAVSYTSKQFYTTNVIPYAIQSTIRKLRKPSITTAASLDGEALIVSVHASRVRFGLSPVDPSDTQQQRLTCCESCARRFRVSTRYSGELKSFQVLSAVCSCLMNNPVEGAYESWMVRAYNPRNNVVYRLHIQNHMIRQLIEASSRLPATSRIKSVPVVNAISDWKAALDESQNATQRSNYCDHLAMKALHDVQRWQSLSDEGMQRRKLAEVDLLHSHRDVVRLSQKLKDAEQDAQRALDFTSRPFHEAQAWDPLENANDWQLLMLKRQTQKELEAAVRTADECRFELFQSKSSEDFLRVQSMQARSTYQNYWLPLAEQQRRIVTNMALELDERRSLAMKMLEELCLKRLTLRDTYLTPIRRSLIVAPALWHEANASTARLLMIAIPNVARGWNILRQEVIAISDKSLEKKTRRMIVSVRMWTAIEDADVAPQNVWVWAYDHVCSSTQRIFLDAELVELLVTPSTIRKNAHASLRRQRLEIAHQLISRCMLDRFTQTFTLEKLQFFHRLRLLRPQFLSSRWFQDLQRGRKRGDGDEVFRQAFYIDRSLCFVVVYENWGDLVLYLYRSSASKTLRKEISLSAVFQMLGNQPTALRLWVCCLRSNQYQPDVIKIILKHLRFTPGMENVEIVGQTLAAASSPRVTIATVIQQRRCLISFRTTVAGDLDIHLYDTTRNENFRLTLEWNTIRRVLSSCDDHGANESAQVRSRNWSLTRNRVEICRWITSRLRFQSLMEHPKELSSVHSALVIGIDVSSTFSMYNEWVRNSTRIPLGERSQVDIERYARVNSTTVFDRLFYEQLAFVPQTHLGNHEKKLIQTRDFIVEGQHTFPACQLKADVYLQRHQIFAVVRDELQKEMCARFEKEATIALEIEELLSLQHDILSTLQSIKGDLAKCRSALALVVDSVTSHLDSFGRVCEALRSRVKAKKGTGYMKVKNRQCDENPARSHIESVEALVAICMLLKKDNDCAFELILQRQSGSVRFVATRLSSLSAYLTDSILARLDLFCAHLPSAMATGAAIQQLRTMRTQSRRFQDTLDPRHLGDTEAVHLSHPEVDNVSNSRYITDMASVLFCPPEVTQACIIPSVGDVEELSMTHFDTLDCTNLVRHTLQALSQRRPEWTTLTMHAKRIRGGTLIFQPHLVHSKTPSWNVRASALATEPVAGVAVFVSTINGPDKFLAVDSSFQSLASQTDHMQRPKTSSATMNGSRRRTQQSKQQLPWRKLSVERIQAARTLRHHHARRGLFVGEPPSDSERESLTLASLRLDVPQVEWMLGSTNLDALIPLIRFEKLHATHSLEQWRLQLGEDNCLHGLFDQDEQELLIQNGGSPIALRFKHIRVRVDDWRHPRRIIFSCQELQTGMQFHTSCSWYQLRLLSANQDQGLQWPYGRHPSSEWRRLARLAVGCIAIGHRNGTIALCVVHPGGCDETPSPVLPTPSSRAMIVGDASTVVAPTTRLTSYQAELRQVMDRCRFRRFMKHQAVVRHAGATRAMKDLCDAMVQRQLPNEWLRMTLEDWRSHERRGLLVLHEKELRRVREAHGRVCKALDATYIDSDHKNAMAIWVDGLARELGVGGDESTRALRARQDAESFLARMNRLNWWREKHPPNERLSLDVADAAEWWRQQDQRKEGSIHRE